jgi:NAD+ synthase
MIKKEITMIDLATSISKWIRNYAQDNGRTTLVVGVSGGVDSAVVSTLCARTGLRTIAVSMPIRQLPDLHNLSLAHCAWLDQEFDNVETRVFDLTDVFELFEHKMSPFTDTLAFANSRSRLRMITLYQIAQSSGGLVVGTGNRVEDFGVGFYTKYGDGGVDIGPIGDLTKTEVWAMAETLGVDQRIIDAPPTDGLWDDGRCDQDQLSGLSYAELERAMDIDEGRLSGTTAADQDLLTQYRAIRQRNLHKMLPIPIYRKEQ